MKPKEQSPDAVHPVFEMIEKYFPKFCQIVGRKCIPKTTNPVKRASMKKCIALLVILIFIVPLAFAKYGPRGTNEYPFVSIAYMPDEFPAGSKSWKPMFTKVYAQDKYTVVIETPDFNVDLMYIVGYDDCATYTPPEMVTAPGGPSKWENRVGTGPYMFKEYVVGSHISYKRNPNYWKKTTIDGVEYQLPFIEEMVKPVIPDVSTRTAALRTGKLDYFWGVPASEWTTLDKQTKGLESNKFLGGFEIRWALNVKNPPLDSLEVRRALMKGTDIAAFGAMEFAGIDVDLPTNWFPMYPYDPAEAKKMLADAGYPNGLKLEVNSQSESLGADRAALLKDQWAKIGVEVDIIAVENALQTKMGFGREYKHVCFDDIETANPILTIRQAGETGHFLNITTSEDKYVDEKAAEMMREINPSKRASMMKDLGVYILGKVYSIPGNTRVNATLGHRDGKRCLSANS